MKRFYKDVAVCAEGDGWRVTLDGRGVKSQGGRAQIVPSRALAEAMAGEWAAQGEDIDRAAFVLRDLADYAIDVIAGDRAQVIAGILRYAETDTLCYRADPDEPLHPRQRAEWEPLVTAAEARWNVRFERVCGIIHRPQPDATLARLKEVLDGQDDFTLAALQTLASLSASLVIALAAIAPEADVPALWDAAELEADWQIEQWGADAEAAARRALRLASFASAARFAALTRA